MIKWNFPGNQDGQIKGVADAGIENVLLTQMIVVGLWNALTVFIFMAFISCLSIG